MATHVQRLVAVAKALVSRRRSHAKESRLIAELAAKSLNKAATEEAFAPPKPAEK